MYFSCALAHISCKPTVRCLALAHVPQATLLYILVHLHTYMMVIARADIRDDDDDADDDDDDDDDVHDDGDSDCC